MQAMGYTGQMDIIKNNTARFRLGILLGVLMLQMGLLHPVLADSDDGIESIQELEHIPARYLTQPYAPYPAPAAQTTAAPPAKKSFLGRLFSPFTKRMSPPILQAPKVVKEPPKETQPLPEPLIRLGKGITYQGKSIPPGFYLLALQPGNANQGAMLTLYKKQQPMVSVPAMALAGSASSSLFLPPPPTPQVTKKASGKQAPEKKAEPEATGSVQLAENGQTLILMYQKGSQQYASIPLTIGEAWQP